MKANRPNPPVFRARLALIWERAARVWWPAALYPAAFAILAMFGVWERLGDPWRALALILVIAASGHAVWRGLRSGPWPTRDDALRRVEADSGFIGRPFEALNDTPTADGPEQRALWTAHQARMAKAAKAARVRGPFAALAAADPFALRGVALIAALAAAWAAGPLVGPRLGDAFALRLLTPVGSGGGVQAWIDPPDYTGRAPRYLDPARPRQSIDAPQGSTLVVRVVGAARAPTLILAGADGQERVAFDDSGPGAFEARAELETDANVRVAGARAPAWRVRIVEDTPPAAAFVKPPEAGPVQEVLFSFSAADDYGLESLHLEVRRADGFTDEVLVHDLPAPRGAVDDEPGLVDLTRHPWAGHEAEFRVAAVDALGQVGRSEPVTLTLPERVFTDPLAKAIAQERRVLVRNDDVYDPLEPLPDGDAQSAALEPTVRSDQNPRRIDRAPADVQRVRRALDLMTLAPDVFAEDPAVHLGLNYAAEALKTARDRDAIAHLPDVLWEAARRADGGALADAERALREAQRALAAALARGADEAEITALMEDYQEAAQRYLEALRRDAIENGRVMDEFAGGGAGGEMGTDDIQEMLRALQELAESGATDDARRALAQLSQLLLNMQMNLSRGGSGDGGEMDDTEQAMREALEELSDLIGRQREVMDQTQRRRDGADDPSGGEDSASGEPSGGAPSSGGMFDQDESAAGDAPNGAGFGPGRSPDQPEPESPGGGDERERLAGGGSGDLTETQRALADQLAALLDELDADDAAGAGDEDGDALGGARETLEDAERAMRGAAEDLDAGRDGLALGEQNFAVETLRRAAERLAQEAFARAMERRGESTDEGDGLTAGRDPLGRRTGAGRGGFGDDVDVPDEMERKQAREILEELRRRAAETGRDTDELDYIRRLLERF